MVRKLMIVMVAGALSLTVACSDKATNGDDSEAGKPYVTAFATNLVADGVGDVALDHTEAACIAAKWVTIFRPERLKNAGIKASDLRRHQGVDDKVAGVALSDHEVAKLVAAFGECEVDLREAYLDSITQGATLSETDRICLTDAFSNDLIDRMMAVEITQGARAVDKDKGLSAEVFQALSACPGAIDLTSP